MIKTLKKISYSVIALLFIIFPLLTKKVYSQQEEIKEEEQEREKLGAEKVPQASEQQIWQIYEIKNHRSRKSKRRIYKVSNFEQRRKKFIPNYFKTRYRKNFQT
jgi:hypothetical protein